MEQDIRLILNEIIKINGRLDRIETKVDDMKTEMTDSFKDMGDIFHHLGNKVYDNLDPRVHRLEFARGHA